MKIVIRAGGIGTRLWPMSRKNNPKQFQKVVGNKTMIRTTYERIFDLAKKPDDIFMSINEQFIDKAKNEVPEIVDKNIIIETDTRNTGPAMCLEVCFLEKYCDSNDVIASLPSDDYISNSSIFRDLLLTTEKFIKENPEYILTPAICPNYPDTGYTYFKAGKNLWKNKKEVIFSVDSIVEKPNLEYCKDLIKTGIYYCHTGMYLWQLGHIVKLFKKFQPNMYKICSKMADDLFLNNKVSTKNRKLYSSLEKISIETVITNKTDKIAMSVSNQIGWSDLGKWHIIKKILKQNRENLVKGNVKSNNSENNLIYNINNKKIIVVNDINNLAIIDTKDALFISSLEKSADVKKIVEKLEEEKLENYL